jgi:glycosyltransferase involved in cell wall biosynthesis
MTGRTARRTLITVSGTIPPDLDAAVAAGRRPRVDYREMQAAFDADLIDHPRAIAVGGRIGRAIARLAGQNAALAWACFRLRRSYDVIVTDGEQVGLPLAALSWLSRRSSSARHVMIVHILSTRSKVLMCRALLLHRRIDSLLVYATAQRDFAVERLGFTAAQTVLTPFMVDTEFFDPGGEPEPSARQVCAAGLEHRDYATLLEACRDLDAKVVIAAASPWSRRRNELDGVALPPNVEVVSLDLFQLRDLYASSRIVVVPLHDVAFQAGITTILEAMSMSRPVVCTQTPGQTDAIVEGETGRYVPPHDHVALRRAMQELLDDPHAARTLGEQARAWSVANADVSRYAERLATVVDRYRTDRALRPTPLPSGIGTAPG